MLANLDEMAMSESLSMALAAHLGKERAHALIQAVTKRALSSRKSLRDAALEEAHVRSALDESAIDQALDPRNYLGATDTFIDRSLSAWRSTIA
jgi:3-carboxy-cis,cis-muconate cycloisomerase